MAERDPRLESHVDLMYDRDFLKAADLRGRPHVLTIKSVAAGNLPKAKTSKTERKPVVEFVEDKRKLALNATNRRTVIRLYGPYGVDWAGKKIEVYPTTKEVDGKPIRDPNTGQNGIEAIRIRERVPGGNDRGKQPAPGRGAVPPPSPPHPGPAAEPDDDYATGDGPPPEDY